MALPLEVCGYKVLSELGQGTFGAVYKVEKDDREYALKKLILSPRALEDDGIPVDLVRELDIVKTIKSKYCVKPLDIISGLCSDKDDKSICLIYDLYDSDVTKKIYNKETSIGPLTIKKWIFQLICGLDHLHMNNILHLDLKPDNILVTKSNNIAITDFGISRRLAKGMDNNVITIWYRPPEFFFKSPDFEIEYTEKADIWSVGCIIYEMIFKNGLFPGYTDEEMEDLLTKQGFDPDSEHNTLDSLLEHIPDVKAYKGVKEVIKGCLQLWAKDRLSTNQLLSLPYFDEFKCEQQCVVYPQLPINLGKGGDKKKLIFKTEVDTISAKYKLSEEILFLAIDIYDRYNTLIKELDYSFKKIARMSIYLACNIYSNKIEKFLDKLIVMKFNPGDLVNLECHMLETLKYILYRPTANTYLHQLAKEDRITKEECQEYCDQALNHLYTLDKYDSVKDIVNYVLKGKFKI